MYFAVWYDERGSGFPWIPKALSTLGRPATSPHLSAIELDFRPSTAKTMAAEMGSDLQWIAVEVARIEHEFEGLVFITVVPDPNFRTLLKPLNVRFRGRNFVVMLIHLSSSLTDPPALLVHLKHGGCLPRLLPLVSHSAAAGYSVTHAASRRNDFSISNTLCRFDGHCTICIPYALKRFTGKPTQSWRMCSKPRRTLGSAR